MERQSTTCSCFLHGRALFQQELDGVRMAIPRSAVQGGLAQVIAAIHVHPVRDELAKPLHVTLLGGSTQLPTPSHCCTGTVLEPTAAHTSSRSTQKSIMH